MSFHRCLYFYFSLCFSLNPDTSFRFLRSGHILIKSVFVYLALQKIDVSLSPGYETVDGPSSEVH